MIGKLLPSAAFYVPILFMNFSTPGVLPKHRRPLAGSLVLHCTLLLLALSGGCGFTVVPPPSPEHPVPVFLLDHGGHASLVLPAEGGMIRYSYGDWQWYALGRTGPAEGSRALIGPNPAGLSRKMLAFSPTEEALRRALPLAVDEVFLIPVEAENAARLQGRLEVIFRENRETLHHNEALGIDFVRHPEPYSLSHNSNTVVAGWLRELGAEVRGGGPFSSWTIGGKSDTPEPE